MLAIALHNFSIDVRYLVIDVEEGTVKGSSVPSTFCSGQTSYDNPEYELLSTSTSTDSRTSPSLLLLHYMYTTGIHNCSIHIV